MWRRRVRKIALVAVSFVAVAAAVLAWLWSDRPDLEQVNWPAPTISSSLDGNQVTVTWLGVTTLLFDDGETQILVDAFFTRPALADIVLGRPVESHAAMVNLVLDEYRIRRLAALVPVHSHFDHALDVGAIANRTRARVLGSESTAAIARGAGVPEDQITTAIASEPYEFGQFTVTLRPSKHAPLGWRGAIPYAGTIDAPLKMPAPVSAWREGGSYTIVIDHPEGTTVVQGSAGFNAQPPGDLAADVVMLGVGGLGSLGRDYARDYWHALVTATGAHSVYPVHFDDYTKPFGDIEPGPRILGSFVKTAAWLEALRDRWDVDTQLFMPEFGRPIAVYAAPVSESET